MTANAMTTADTPEQNTPKNLNLHGRPERIATVERNTAETQITCTVNLDGTGKGTVDTGVPFLDHMIDQIKRHGLFDLEIKCNGDTFIDDHHSVEDTGITLGQAFNKALGDKKGIRRYGHFYAPLDEALTRAVVDLSGRPGLHMDIPFTRSHVGNFDVDLFSEFFYGFVNHSWMTVHLDNLKGKNSHHQIESTFKAFARALRMACEYDERALNTLPSTKEAF
ncbi:MULTISPECIES: imidazoleglycerol-phosphate dehydratase HisB [unclassified Psychrobacter]|uniref:imidazoleglycerol-phosphate dehydratase HisB n=1 Tax=unclassified Psychrobacter TaxID=196806 RepID=UPI000713EAC6|nr:imidazoleglycerol-phosphate dehydratase HisB [Psychrobacter sp. P11F6]KRG32627.1 imidazoleglycerol-phosphate dehydratase [Psychrobacter sp. P11F6]